MHRRITPTDYNWPTLFIVKAWQWFQPVVSTESYWVPFRNTGKFSYVLTICKRSIINQVTSWVCFYFQVSPSAGERDFSTLLQSLPIPHPRQYPGPYCGLVWSIVAWSTWSELTASGAAVYRTPWCCMDGDCPGCRIGTGFCSTSTNMLQLNSGTNHLEVVQTIQDKGHLFQQTCFHIQGFL